MQSILFAILIVISVNIQPAEAQSKEPEKPKQAEAVQEVDNLQRRIIAEKDGQAEVAHQELLIRRGARLEIARQAEAAQAVVDGEFKRKIRTELFAKMQNGDDSLESAVEVLSDADAVQYVQSVRKKFLVELTTAFIEAIKVGDMERYQALSNLRKEYGYTESQIIISASSTIPFEEDIRVEQFFNDKHSEVFEWMRMLVSAKSNKEFFTLEMIRILSSAISSNIKLLPVYRGYIVSLEETAQENNNSSALIFLNNVDEFLTKYNNKEQLTQRLFHILLQYYIRHLNMASAGISVLFSISMLTVITLFMPPWDGLGFGGKVIGGGLLVTSALSGWQAVQECRAAFSKKTSEKASKELERLN